MLEYGNQRKSVENKSNFSLKNNILEEITKDRNLSEISNEFMSTCKDFVDGINGGKEKEELVDILAKIVSHIYEIEYKMDLSETYINDLATDIVIKKLGVK